MLQSTYRSPPAAAAGQTLRQNWLSFERPEVKLVSLPPEQLLAQIDRVVAVYRAAFCTAPYHKDEEEVADFATSLPAHTSGPDFRFLAAYDGEPEQMIAFAYGRATLPGQPWHDLVRAQLLAAGLEAWLADSYQLAQMAVHPAYHRQGIGGRLHDALLADAPPRRALLTTMAAETPAYYFYRRRGWQVLVGRFAVPGLARPYQIMGRT